jgi:branched-subunit amino acid aminotransferase/4-amino-4-deoxychorismate lyase
VLGGITQMVIEKLAFEADLVWKKQTISVDQFAAADEILMMGTDGGLWFARSVNGNPLGDGRAAGTYLLLRNRFDSLVGSALQQNSSSLDQPN